QKRTQSKLKDRLAAVFQEVRSTPALTQACASAKREDYLLTLCVVRDLQFFVREVEHLVSFFFQIGNVIIHRAPVSLLSHYTLARILNGIRIFKALSIQLSRALCTH